MGRILTDRIQIKDKGDLWVALIDSLLCENILRWRIYK
jgi:hypothetical protein